MGDNPTIPVGDPGTLEIALCHQCWTFSRSNIDLQASNHHSVNLTQSVIMNCQKLDSPNSFFYTDQLYTEINISDPVKSNQITRCIEKRIQ